jgi:hypothetical protein
MTAILAPLLLIAVMDASLRPIALVGCLLTVVDR